MSVSRNFKPRSSGTQYTSTVALLAGAFIFIPTVLVASRPYDTAMFSLALAASLVCAALAWRQWNRHSDLTMLAIVPVPARTN